ncbi:hypothetical protein F2Q69_00020292 [Brassica cretica]|uniref:Uncharacterized protein n=1 Tax=Brassica cretica TaxID=69181 RepID=A0A8S9QT31_BRACR|nr:hypothetical protein F2Q69_00020292 [Brassica cretica]
MVISHIMPSDLKSVRCPQSVSTPPRFHHCASAEHFQTSKGANYEISGFDDVAHNDDNSDSLPDGQTFEIGAGAEILRFWNVFASLESEIKTTCAGSVDSAALRTTSVFSSAPLDIPTVHP